MADETDAPSTPVASTRAVIVVFAFVAMLLAAAIAVVAIMRVGSATAAQDAAAVARLVRLDVARLRHDAETRDRKLIDLAARIEADAAKLVESLKVLSEVDARIQRDVSEAADQQRRQVELSSAVQQATTDTLTRLSERMEELRTEVVLKEARALQGQIVEATGRIELTEKDVTALRQALKEADVASLRAEVQDVDRELTLVGTDLKTLTTASEAFRVQTTRASEAFKAQVTEFFQRVLYNDPWGRSTPDAPAPPPAPPPAP